MSREVGPPLSDLVPPRESPWGRQAYLLPGDPEKAGAGGRMHIAEFRVCPEADGPVTCCSRLFPMAKLPPTVPGPAV